MRIVRELRAPAGAIWGALVAGLTAAIGDVPSLEPGMKVTLNRGKRWLETEVKILEAVRPVVLNVRIASPLDRQEASYALEEVGDSVTRVSYVLQVKSFDEKAAGVGKTATEALYLGRMARSLGDLENAALGVRVPTPQEASRSSGRMSVGLSAHIAEWFSRQC